jgi:4-carboxymuconolactone decarboxylase
MPRLPELAPEQMTADQRRVHDMIVAGPRGRVQGPLAVWLRRPELAARAQALGEYCRYNSSLPKRLSELAILVTARHWQAEFEWYAHRQHGLQAGLPEHVIEAIRIGEAPSFADAEQQAVYDIATAMYRDRRLGDALYARGLEVLGESRLIDLIGVLGYYALISMTIQAFEVTPPDGTPLAFDGGAEVNRHRK